MIQLARDKDTGELKTIYEVPSGSDCGCICSCGKDLIAKNNGKSIDKPLLIKQKDAHFAHKGDCEYKGETTLHLLAKETLKRNKKLRVFFLKEKEDGLINTSEIIEFDSAETERNYPNEDVIRPDVTLKKVEKILFVEFYVTHKVDKEKKEKIKRIAESVIEIDLNFIGFNPIKYDKPNFYEMEVFLENYPERISNWICNNKRDDLIKRKITFQEHRVEEAKKTYEEKLVELNICKEQYHTAIDNYKEANLINPSENFWFRRTFNDCMYKLGCERIQFDSDKFNNVYAICPYIILQNKEKGENQKMAYENCLKCPSHHTFESSPNRPFCSYNAKIKHKVEVQNVIDKERERNMKLKAYSDNLNEFMSKEFELVERKLRELESCNEKLKDEESKLEKLGNIK